MGFRLFINMDIEFEHKEHAQLALKTMMEAPDLANAKSIDNFNASIEETEDDELAHDV